MIHNFKLFFKNINCVYKIRQSDLYLAITFTVSASHFLDQPGDKSIFIRGRGIGYPFSSLMVITAQCFPPLNYSLRCTFRKNVTKLCQIFQMGIFHLCLPTVS